jgi:hypothetical protein
MASFSWDDHSGGFIVAEVMMMPDLRAGHVDLAR